MNKAAIRTLLLTNDQAVDRAMQALYRRQTEDEKAERSTKHSNGIGFNASDAKLGTYYARWCNSGRRLTGQHLVKARQIALRYVGQLLDIAQSKQRANAQRAAAQEWRG